MGQSYGVKISNEGKDARRSLISDMSFTSGENTFRVINKGSLVATFAQDSYEAFGPTVQAGVLGKSGSPNLGESFPTSTIHIIGFLDFGEGPYGIPAIGSFLTRYIGGQGWFYPMAAIFGANIQFQAWRTSNTADQWGGTYPGPFSVTFYYYIICVTADDGAEY